jgi:hypothetical protein
VILSDIQHRQNRSDSTKVQIHYFSSLIFFSVTIQVIIIMKSRMMRWAGHVAREAEKMKAYSLLVGKPKGKRSLGRPRRGWVDLGEVGW